MIWNTAYKVVSSVVRKKENSQDIVNLLIRNSTDIEPRSVDNKKKTIWKQEKNGLMISQKDLKYKKVIGKSGLIRKIIYRSWCC